MLYVVMRENWRAACVRLPVQKAMYRKAHTTPLAGVISGRALYHELSSVRADIPIVTDEDDLFRIPLASEFSQKKTRTEVRANLKRCRSIHISER